MITVAKIKDADSPRLWLKRMVLFASPEKRDAPIRDIPLHRGLNIIWGVELPDDAGIDAAHPVTLSGHSVGKTTCCRLIRYCLGETTFGNPAAMSRIRNTFPESWVGMELTVGGQEWLVLKPIGRSGNPKAAQGIAIEHLFDLDRKQNNFSVFTEHLHSTMMSGLRDKRPSQFREVLRVETSACMANPAIRRRAFKACMTGVRLVAERIRQDSRNRRNMLCI
ncbi:MAG: hypothetical protein IPG33_10180 [Betaproteobacteria bacterium]|nr:hypothetical protein [Betaproteobacteria bacterium]